LITDAAMSAMAVLTAAYPIRYGIEAWCIVRHGSRPAEGFAVKESAITVWRDYSIESKGYDRKRLG
jgi:hypothetical protein